MSSSKCTGAQMITALKPVEAGRTAEDLAREYNLCRSTRSMPGSRSIVA